MDRLSRLRLAACLAAAALLPACTGTGINAGEQGGRAFIALAIMLVVTVGLLALFLGRED